jgi:beta-1,4-mannosyltransferase
MLRWIESDPHPDIVSNPNITIVPLRPHPAILQTSNKLLFTIFGPLKVLFQVAYLWQCLAYTTAPSRWIIVQVARSQNIVRMTEASLLLVEPTIYSYIGSGILVLLPTANTTYHRLA